MDIAVNAIFGTLILLVLGWLKLDINRMHDGLSARIDKLSDRIGALEQRVAHLEGRLDEWERLKG